MRTIGGALALISVLGGCSGTIFKTYDIDETSLALDARQRTVISAPRPYVDEHGRRRVVCAEPSPDAISALASSTEGSLSLAEFLGLQGSAGAAAKRQVAEQVAYIGARNSTIQLLRDSLYRACEAYMNGGIGDFGYALILTNYGKLMVSLLTAEGMTRPGFVPPIIIGTVPGESGGTTTQASSNSPSAPAGGEASVTATGGTGAGGAGSNAAVVGQVPATPGLPLDSGDFRLVFEKVLAMANPAGDETGKTKAIEVMVSCFLMMDRSGVRPALEVGNEGVREACSKLVNGAPEYILTVLTQPPAPASGTTLASSNGTVVH